MSVDVVEFTAMPHTTPDTFTWAVTNGEWFAEGAWTTDTPYLRKTPQFIGDKIVVNVKGVYSTPGVNRNINITNDVTLSEMTISEGYERSAVFTATNTPANLTFDSLGDMSYIRISSQLRHLYLGNSDTNNNLSITLNKPLIITRGSAWAVEIHTYAALSGGSATSPSDIVLDVTGDQYCQLYMYLFNTNNTFRGDVYVGNTGNNSSTSELRAGSSANLANDKQFGHSDNKIILRQNSTLTLFGPSATPAEFARNLHGNGTFATSGAGGVALTESAKLRPHAKTGEDGFGTITIRAESFADVAKTQYEFKIADDDTSMADKLVFDVTGDVSVTGKINIIPASKYTPIGESWEIMTINKQETTSFSHKLKGVPHPLNTSMCFRFYVEEKENGWVVKAQSECPTVLIVK